VRDLWRAAKCEDAVDLTKLRDGMIHAASAYNEEISSAPNERRREIEALLSAASRRRFEDVAAALERLSLVAKTSLLERALKHPLIFSTT